MSEIFISYSRKDKAWVSTLAEKLEANGYKVWWDPELLPGQDFENIIKQKLETSDCVICVWSKSSIASKWVRAESSYAMEQDKLIPVLLEQVKPPMPFGQVHTENLFDWEGKESHEGYQQLLKAITLLTQKKPLKPEYCRKKLLQNRLSSKLTITSLVILTLIIVALYYSPKISELFSTTESSGQCFNANEIHNSSDNLDNKFVLISAGSYIVGKKTEHRNTLQEVTTEQPLHLDAYEVTNKQYLAFLVKSNVKEGNSLIPKFWDGLRYADGRDFYPVIGINSYSAEQYCYSVGKRLPEAQEWEIACRYFTTDNKKQRAQCNALYPVGSYNGEKPALFNMMDNVSEWTSSPQGRKVYNLGSTQNINEGELIAKGHNYTIKDLTLSCTDNLSLAPSVNTSFTGLRCIK